MPQAIKDVDLDELATAPFGRQVAMLRSIFGLNQRDFAEILAVPAGTLERWERQGGAPKPDPRNKYAVEAVKTVAEALGDLFTPDVIRQWAQTPNPTLNGERPVDFIKTPGGFLRIAHLLGNLGK